MRSPHRRAVSPWTRAQATVLEEIYQKITLRPGKAEVLSRLRVFTKSNLSDFYGNIADHHESVIAYMKRLLPLVTLLTLSSLALAGGRSGSMQVSFVIKEACAIESAARATTVRCNVDAPFHIQAAPQRQPAANAAPAVKSEAGITVITF